MAVDKRIIGPVEMQEFLFSKTISDGCFSAIHGMNGVQREKLTKDIREVLRLHRFSVFTWLLMSGVSVPANLLADETHPKVGYQLPDQPENQDELKK